MRRAAALGAVLALAACDGGDGAQGLTTTPGDSVLVPSVTSATLTASGGGLYRYPPPGAACDPMHWSYTVTLASANLAWSTCSLQGVFEDPASFVPVMANRTLTAAELASVKDALRAVVVSDRTTCGADKVGVDLLVRSAADSLDYGDDFYACTGHPPYVKTEGLDGLSAVLAPLAH